MITVSVSMITYNHEKYLKKSIEGVLMQQVDFPMELIISNDNSTDKTDEIINDVIENYHGNIKIRYYKHQENKGATENFIWTISQAKGKYIAICDGDDYWIDPYKLQKQVDFMEKNPDVVICGTESILRNEINKTETKSFESSIKYFTFDDFIKGSFVNTLTVLFRKPNKIPDFVKQCSYTDYCLWMYLLKKDNGKAVKLPDVTAIYRIHKDGVYSGKGTIKRDIETLETRLYVTRFIGDAKIARKYLFFYLYEIKKLIKRSVVYLLRSIVYLKYMMEFMIIMIRKKFKN